ncbi:MAG: hypothetical protein ACE5F1_02135 [Planctomycetota bacterium]
MTKFFKNLDFWSSMILFGFLASVGLGVWHVLLLNKMKDTVKAYELATSGPGGGQIVDILSDLKEIKELEKAAQTGGRETDAGAYFQTQLLKGGISMTEYLVKEQAPRKVRFKTRSGNKTANERRVGIDFAATQTAKTRRYYSRAQIFSAVFNAESRSNMWKLRELRLTAEQVKSKSRSGRRSREEGYPRPLNDQWYVDRMVFVAREPVKH